MLMIHLPIVCAGLLASPIAAPATDAFAAPRIIMLHGGSLEQPIYLTDWQDNLQFIGAISDPAQLTRSAIDTTGAIQVAMFWHGPTWDVYAREPARLPELMQHLGSAQRGALYLPPQATGPLLDYRSAQANPGLRTISPVGLVLLQRAGLPLPTVSDSLLVAGVLTAFHADLATGDSTGALAWLAADAVVLEAGTRESRQEYRDHHLAADMQYARSSRTTRTPPRVTVVGDAAWAESTSETTRTADGRTTRSTGAELMVLGRTHHGWQIRAIHWSSRQLPRPNQ